MQIPLYQVDAFASRVFRGNPAAVCPLEHWLPDETLQAIASENNLAETAFYVPNGEGYHLRWFTPAVEVDLCGHATLATAYVILESRREAPGARVIFESKSGELIVERRRLIKRGDETRSAGLYTLDFPSRPPEECPVNAALIEALGAEPRAILRARDYLCVFESEEQVRAIKPHMEKLAAIDAFAAIVTAPGRECDFVSRFFAPAKGVPEDPVTGSSHCTLIPYWSKHLGKKRLYARQISRRGGELWCQDGGARVKIAGRAVQYLEGHIEIG